MVQVRCKCPMRLPLLHKRSFLFFSSSCQPPFCLFSGQVKIFCCFVDSCLIPTLHFSGAWPYDPAKFPDTLSHLVPYLCGLASCDPCNLCRVQNLFLHYSHPAYQKNDRFFTFLALIFWDLIAFSSSFTSHSVSFTL